MNITIKKGHDIQITGVPSGEIKPLPDPPTLAILPVEFRGVKPKLLVKEGDAVHIGSPLFFDKTKPEIKFASPGGGTIKVIQFGPRRVLEKIEIDLDRNEEHNSISFPFEKKIETLNREKVLETILSANLFHLIRQRPFNKVGDPKDEPRDIFISAINSAPLTVDLELILKDSLTQFQSGITVLSKLTEGNVYLGLRPDSSLNEIKHAECVTVNGPHPAGNIGIQIHHTSPIKPGEVIWTVNAQDVVVLGNLFLTGKYDPTRVVTMGGLGVKDPVHVRTRAGISMASLLHDQLVNEPSRIISGDVLTGKEIYKTGFLGFYETTVSVLPDTVNREFLGMLRPGNKYSRYSLSSAFLKLGNAQFDFNTSQSGSHRAMVPLNAWEKVLPMDIFPNALYRAILAKDVEEMEQLGIWECDDEDFALCSFACPSKIDVGGVIRQGLDLMEIEG
ncbi:MAG: Na(+)-translocating NADH-quinone reductase subunit A [Candidatus Marinimicrobia bacterium]|jgi:Na+-transporting NADH:ubiquinone oxidoreductase subunit A|nr:Na(+)-translocating NADH-quinone reductase subunit A [Candidatus Neomarinimicrobiota bacterium]